MLNLLLDCHGLQNESVTVVFQLLGYQYGMIYQFKIKYASKITHSFQIITENTIVQGAVLIII